MLKRIDREASGSSVRGNDVERHHHRTPIQVDLTTDELAGRDRGEVGLMPLASIDQLARGQSLMAIQQILNGIPCDEVRRVVV